MNPATKNRLAFLYGLGSITQIRIVGAMGITEAVCVLLAPFVLVKMWPKLRDARAQKILLLLFLWFISAILTDLYRETSTDDALKGIFALPFLFAVFIVAFALLWDDVTRVRWMVLGTAISGIISMYTFQTQAFIARADSAGLTLEEAMSFKTYYAGIVFFIISVLVVFLFRRWPLFVALLLFVASGIFLVQGSRSIFLTLILSAGGAWLSRGRFPMLRRVQNNTVLLLVFIAIGGMLATEIYSYSVQRGWMGEEELDKYRMQSASDIGLLRGRADFVGSLLAIKDSPILGHGSWAVDKDNYGMQLLEYIGDKETARIYSQQSITSNMRIPTHSHIWQAWVWHGFFGGLFWMYVLVLIVRFFKKSLHLCRPLIAYNILLLIAALWDLFFSPFSSRPRWGMVFAIVLLGLAEAARRRRAVRQGVVLSDIDAPWDGRWSI
jgi:hypothetical protein